MPPAPYPDFRWFFRTLRVLPIVAIAALAGGIIGGFSIFAINLALTAPPNHAVPPEPGSKLASETTNASAAVPPAPMRAFDVATPAPAPAVATSPAPTSAAPAGAAAAAATSASSALSRSQSVPVVEPAPVSAQDISNISSNISPAHPAKGTLTPAQAGEIDGTITVVHPQANAANEQPSATPASPGIAATPPQQQTSWPDALSREHKAVPNNETAAVPQVVTTPRPQSESADERSTPQTVDTQTAQKPTVPQGVKARVAVRRPQAPAERASETASGEARPLYDYSRQDEQGAGRDSAVLDDHAPTKYLGKNAAKSSRTKFGTKPRYDARNAPPVDVERASERADGRTYERSDDRDGEDGDSALPAQPAPPPLPFFGLFGGGDRD